MSNSESPNVSPIKSQAPKIVILPDKIKCRNFLASLLQTSGQKNESIRKKSLYLTQALIDAHLNVETFWNEMAKGIRCPKPDLEFLQKNLPDLRLSLLRKELEIDGILPPKMQTCQPTNATTNNGNHSGIEVTNINGGQKRRPDVMVNEEGQKSLKFHRNLDGELSNFSSGQMDQSVDRLGPSGSNTANTTVTMYQHDRTRMLQLIDNLDSAVIGVLKTQCAKIMDDLISEHDQVLGAKNIAIESLKSLISDLKVEHGSEIADFMKEMENFEAKDAKKDTEIGKLKVEVENRDRLMSKNVREITRLKAEVAQIKSESENELDYIKSKLDVQLEINRKNEEKMKKLAEEANRRNLLLREYQIKWANFNVETEKCLANLLPESIEIDED